LRDFKNENKSAVNSEKTVDASTNQPAVQTTVPNPLKPKRDQQSFPSVDEISQDTVEGLKKQQESSLSTQKPKQLQQQQNNFSEKPPEQELEISKEKSESIGKTIGRVLFGVTAIAVMALGFMVAGPIGLAVATWQLELCLKAHLKIGMT
jgi:preprotein translocase subunit SecF